MNELMLNFEFGENPVRTITKSVDEIWFVGKDVAIALGHTNPERAIRKFVDDEDKGVTVLVTPGGQQEVTIINEPGVYSLVFASQTENAKQFKRWVTHDVLPSIRKKGYFSLSCRTSSWRLCLMNKLTALWTERDCLEKAGNREQFFSTLSVTKFPMRIM